MSDPQLLEVDDWLTRKELEHLEFKEAKNRYDFEELVRYCVALANEKGGNMVLGISDKIPRTVVGSQAFPDLERTKAGLTDRLRLRIEADEILHPNGRVVVFRVPSRPIGVPIQYKGAYWMRSGEDLVPMTADQLQRIFAEAGPDFSAEICAKASVTDLDPQAIEWFRSAWQRKSGNPALADLPASQLLEDAELIVDGKPTYAALVLLGTHRALGRHLDQAEVVFEYRSQDTAIEHEQRIENRRGFFLYHDELWKTINLRNPIQHYQQGLFVWDIPTFNEKVIREALLNAVGHRDYRLSGSVFVRQFSRHLEVVSPGGFPPGVTAQNILFKQSPRNRRIADTLGKCGLVERSGQGADRMFEESIREGKPRPDFSGTDDYQVALTLRGQVQDPRFLQFLERVNKELQVVFSTQDLVILDMAQRHDRLTTDLVDRAQVLKQLGVLETIGRGRGRSFILSRSFYRFLGKSGTYTRKRGLDRETNKELLLKHLDHYGRATISDFEEILPHLNRDRIYALLKELRSEGRIRRVGEKRGSQWAKA
ncbi:MAG: putative DNA binding domain-containing protein [Candidatus Riflebacteria bacterium]|nr:putative DNA binding domain-containing protein [Candidatus Riflebacteria bacterium]